jgi:hypothetical protein
MNATRADESASLEFTLRPRVDEVTAALARVGEAEKAAQTTSNGALAKLRSRAIDGRQFADVVERQVLPPWRTVQTSVATLSGGDDRADVVVKIQTYMALRAEGWRLLAQAVRTGDAGMMKKASETQIAALAIFKGAAPAASGVSQPHDRAAVPH